MADFLPLPDKEYQVIYADPPWEYRQHGTTAKSRGNAAQHYPTMTTEDICKLPVKKICGGEAACFMWATFPNIAEAIKVLEAWGFVYKTAAFVWIKKNRKNGGNFWGMGAYTRANAEVCLLGVSPGFRAKDQIRSHRVHQVIEAPFEGHSKSRTKRAGGSWNCWGTFPGWKCSPGTAPQGGTPGETRCRRNRRTTWHKRNGQPACGWVWR